jgi:hypothetical protein
MHLAIKVCVLDDEDEEENLKQTRIILCLSSQQKKTKQNKTKQNKKKKKKVEHPEINSDKNILNVKSSPTKKHKKTRLVCHCGSIKLKLQYIVIKK